MGETDGEFVVVLMTRAGRESVSQGDAEAELRPGDALIWDSEKPARFSVWEPLSKRSLLIPRAALEEVNGRAWTPAGVTLNGEAPATRLLVSYLDALSATLPALGSSAVSAARNATLELLMGALRADGEVPSTSATHPALRAAMDRYIERHLLDGALTLNDIATAHGVSVRTVNRIFNATGQTVGEVIRVRRLARAREDLADSALSVSTIAHRGLRRPEPLHPQLQSPLRLFASGVPPGHGRPIRSSIWRLSTKTHGHRPVRLGTTSPFGDPDGSTRHRVRRRRRDPARLVLRRRTAGPVRRPPSSWRTASRPSRRCTSTSSPRRSPRPGLNALVFDNRNFGASDGEPRQEIDPGQQVRDYRHAITYAAPSTRSTRRGSGSGAAATRVGTCSWSARSTAA